MNASYEAGLFPIVQLARIGALAFVPKHLISISSEVVVASPVMRFQSQVNDEQANHGKEAH